MSDSVAQPAFDGHPVLPDIGRPVMAKADVRNPDIDWNVRIGRAIQRAVLMVWESNKLAAADLDVDDAEFGKWLNGTRRPQFDRLFAWEPLREPLVAQLAKLGGADVQLLIVFRRPA